MDINAHELRIGNLFQEEKTKEIIMVTELSIEKIGFSGWFEKDWQAEPIPLTKEWLLKFGFDEDEEYYSKGTKHYHLPSKSFYLGNDHVSGGNSDAKIVYVHQLQNLFFSLCGEELTI